ncbi:MAG TPA: hypothetical protein VIR79_06925 [Nitrospira sp.]
MMAQDFEQTVEQGRRLSPPQPATADLSQPVTLGRGRWFWLLYAICCFLFVEASLQLYYRVTTGDLLYHRDKPPLWATDPYSGWTNRPYLTYRHVTPEFAVDLHTNSGGFRVSSQHEEYPIKKPDGTFRILLLGPSFAFGWGVDYEDTFGAQLERVMDEMRFAPGQTIEVLNHGVPALPAANQLEWFRKVGKHYSPDLVIHFVYGSLETSSHPDRSLTVTNGQLLPSGASPVEFMWGYAKNSATIFYTGILVGQIGKAAGLSGQGRRIEGAGRALHTALPFDVQSAAVKESTTFYRAFRAAAHESNAKFLVVHFPLAYVVHPEDRARWALHGVENIEVQETYNHAFADHLNRQAIPCLNLTQDLMEEAKRNAQRLYYWLDVHWTPWGNRRSAELVGQYVGHRYQGWGAGINESRASAREQ